MVARRDRRKGKADAWPDVPRLPESRHLQEADGTEFRAEGVIERAILRAHQAPGTAARDLVIRESDVASLGAGAATLERSVFEDVRMAASDFVGATLDRSRWTRVSLDGCRLSGANLDEAALHDVAFVDCQMDHVRLEGSRLQRVSFIRCSLRGAYLMESILERVRMIDCDLGEMDLRHATVSETDVRQSRLEGIGLELGQFAGLTVTSEQALDLAIRIGGLSVDDHVVVPGRL